MHICINWAIFKLVLTGYTITLKDWLSWYTLIAPFLDCIPEIWKLTYCWIVANLLSWSSTTIFWTYPLFLLQRSIGIKQALFLSKGLNFQLKCISFKISVLKASSLVLLLPITSCWDDVTLKQSSRAYNQPCFLISILNNQ